MGVVKAFGCNYIEFDFAYFIFVNNLLLKQKPHNIVL